MSLMEFKRSAEATPEQIRSYQDKLYNAYQSGNILSMQPRSKLLRRGWVSRVQRQLTDIMKSKVAENAMKLHGNDLWNYAQNANQTIGDVATNLQKMYDENMAAERAQLRGKLGGIIEKLGD